MTQIAMKQGVVRRRVFWMTSFLQVGILVEFMSQNAVGATRNYPVASHGELQLSLEKDWKDVLKPSPMNLTPTIEISPRSGNDFRFMLTALVPSKKQQFGGADLKSSVERMSEPSVAQSIEKTVEVRRINGDRNEGYYFSLTDSAQAPGEYKCMTQGLVRVGELLISFTILSNDTTQKVRDAALDVLRSALQLKAQVSADLEIPIPGQGWRMHLLNPGMADVHQQSGPSGLKFDSMNDDCFRFTAFVEKPAGSGQRHDDVFNHYWKMAGNNPLIDEKSIRVEKGEKFVKVRYLTATMPNVNYYFAYKGQWVYLHISKLPYDQKDEALFADFEKHLSYGE